MTPNTVSRTTWLALKNSTVTFLNRLKELFRQPPPAATSVFDPAACIRMLLDKTEAEWNRDAAAESLGYGELGPHLSQAIDALFQVACDQQDSFDIREEAAQSLGEIWGRIGVDLERFARIPDDVRFETWASMPEKPLTRELRPMPHSRTHFP